MLDRRGFGNLCRLREHGVYGREIPLATIIEEDALALVKWLRKIVGVKALTREHLETNILPRIPEFTGGGEVSELVTRGNTLSARLDFSGNEIEAIVDHHGHALESPPEREAVPNVCRGCDQLEHDLNVQITASPAYAWRRLGLVEEDGTPTRRGIVFSFFQGGEGLAIAAALEDENYPINDLVFDLANIRGGPRFAGDDAVMGGRLGIQCQRVYERADHPGYLEMGTPVHYGSGASEVIREVITNSTSRYKLTNESLRTGDIERALMEWRSLLRHIVNAPPLNWSRWTELKDAARHFIDSTTSPTILDFPPLLASQQRRTLI
jgi:hypothetical protein